MAKTNFSRVEDILGQGLHKMTVDKLLVLADVAACMGDSDLSKAARDRLSINKMVKKRKRYASSIKRDLEYLFKNEKNLYRSLNLNKREIFSLLDDPKSLNDDEWKQVEKLYRQLAKYKNEMLGEGGGHSDEDIVENERLKHINKRFNVNEKWLPLQ